MLRDLILFALGAYMLILLVMFIFQRNFIYFPAPTKPDLASYGLSGMEEIRIPTADGLNLLGWYLPPRAPEGRVILHFHGNAGHIGFRTGRAAILTQIAGDGILLLEYRGYGGNRGRPDEKGLEQDAQAAMAALRKRGFSPDRVILYGESLGSGPAVFLAQQMAQQEQPVAGLILEAAFTSLPDIAARIYPIFPVRLLMQDRFPNAARIAEIDTPLLILHGLRDRTIPPDMAQSLYDRAQHPKQRTLSPHGDHNDLFSHPDVQDALRRFLSGNPASAEINADQ